MADSNPNKEKYHAIVLGILFICLAILFVAYLMFMYYAQKVELTVTKGDITYNLKGVGINNVQFPSFLTSQS